MRALGVDRDTLRGLNPALAAGGLERPAPDSGRLCAASAGGLFQVDRGSAGAAPGRQPSPSVVAAGDAADARRCRRLPRPQPRRPRALTAPAPAGYACPRRPVAATVPAAARGCASAAAPAAPRLAADAAAARSTTLVQTDDTGSTIAARTGVTVNKLMALIRCATRMTISTGRAPAAGGGGARAGDRDHAPPTLDAAKAAVQESQEEDQAVAAARQAGCDDRAGIDGAGAGRRSATGARRHRAGIGRSGGLLGGRRWQHPRRGRRNPGPLCRLARHLGRRGCARSIICTAARRWSWAGASSWISST